MVSRRRGVPQPGPSSSRIRGDLALALPALSGAGVSRRRGVLQPGPSSSWSRSQSRGHSYLALARLALARAGMSRRQDVPQPGPPKKPDLRPRRSGAGSSRTPRSCGAGVRKHRSPVPSALSWSWRPPAAASGASSFCADRSCGEQGVGAYLSPFLQAVCGGAFDLGQERSLRAISQID